jgi:hypothetical protein
LISAKVMGQNSFGPKTSLKITAPLCCVGDTIYGQNGACTHPGDGSALYHCPAGYRYVRKMKYRENLRKIPVQGKSMNQYEKG